MRALRTRHAWLEEALSILASDVERLLFKRHLFFMLEEKLFLLLFTYDDGVRCVQHVFES